MGGISIEIIINDDNSLRLGTIINKYNKDVGYEFGSLSLSPGLSKLIRGRIDVMVLTDKNNMDISKEEYEGIF